jgi:hypothetical protein
LKHRLDAFVSLYGSCMITDCIYVDVVVDVDVDVDVGVDVDVDVC